MMSAPISSSGRRRRRQRQMIPLLLGGLLLVSLPHPSRPQQTDSNRKEQSFKSYSNRILLRESIDRKSEEVNEVMVEQLLEAFDKEVEAESSLNGHHDEVAGVGAEKIFDLEELDLEEALLGLEKEMEEQDNGEEGDEGENENDKDEVAEVGSVEIEGISIGEGDDDLGEADLAEIKKKKKKKNKKKKNKKEKNDKKKKKKKEKDDSSSSKASKPQTSSKSGKATSSPTYKTTHAPTVPTMKSTGKSGKSSGSLKSTRSPTAKGNTHKSSKATKKPARAPTPSPTLSPDNGGGGTPTEVEATLIGLTMEMYGITDFGIVEKLVYEAMTSLFIEDFHNFYENGDGLVSNVQANVTVMGYQPPDSSSSSFSGLRHRRRKLKKTVDEVNIEGFGKDDHHEIDGKRNDHIKNNNIDNQENIIIKFSQTTRKTQGSPPDSCTEITTDSPLVVTFLTQIAYTTTQPGFVTPRMVISSPFRTPELRSIYVTDYLKDPGPMEVEVEAFANLECVEPIEFPETNEPTASPSKEPTRKPTRKPTDAPTNKPTMEPTDSPTKKPTMEPTRAPTKLPTASPTKTPTGAPTKAPTETPTRKPTSSPTVEPGSPTPKPTTGAPTKKPTDAPTELPTGVPSEVPTNMPTKKPTVASEGPTPSPTNAPTAVPTTKVSKHVNNYSKTSLGRTWI